MLLKAFLLIYFLTVLSFANTVDSDEESDEVFKPTSEWKTVKQGQSIPPGLHVRMNLETGEKQAKRLDEEDKHRGPQNTAVTTVLDEKENSESEDINMIIDPEEIKVAIKNITGSKANTSEENENKSSFRSYEELKREMDDLKLTVKTDFELMSELVIKYKSLLTDGSDEEKLTVLKDLEYLVHQYDNAQDFVKIGGISDIVYPSLNMSSPFIRSEAIKLLGSAVQGNPKVQIYVLDGGGLNKVLKILALDEIAVVRTRALYAVSCLVRRFPAAQNKLLAEGGLSVLAKLFENEQQENLRLQMKVITLIHDLLLERIDVKKMANLAEGPTAELKEKIRQYNAAGIEDKLVEQEWCKRIPEFLIYQSKTKSKSDRRDDLSSAIGKNIPIRPEHDIVEKVVSTMLVMTHLCINDFKENKDIKSVLLDLKDWYGNLASKEEIERKSSITEDNYFYYTGLYELVLELIEELNIVIPKDEL